MGKDCKPQIRNPVANIIIPPQAVKSPIRAALVRGTIHAAVVNKVMEIKNCGTQMVITM